MNPLQFKQMLLRRFHEIIFYGSPFSAAVAVFIFLNWIAVFVVGVLAFIVLSAAYSILARLRGLRRLNWNRFFSDFGNTSSG